LVIINSKLEQGLVEFHEAAGLVAALLELFYLLRVEGNGFFELLEPFELSRVLPF
jgi:hypothetical protein